MGRRGALTENEKAKIIQGLQKKQSTLEIAKMLGRDHRTIKKYATNPQSCNGRADKGKIREKSGVSRRVISLIKREVHRNPLETSKQVLEAVGMFNVPKSTRCSILQRIAKCKKPLVRPPLKQVHREKRLEWAKKYLKQNFECRATLDGPDGWRQGWCDTKALCPQHIRHQQGGGGVMFWAAIIHDELVGPFQVKDKKKSLAFRNKMVFHAG